MFWVVVGVIVLGGLITYGVHVARMSPEERRAFFVEQRERAEAQRANQRERAEAQRADQASSRASTNAQRGIVSISAAGDTSTGILACPRCKGTQFKAKPSLGRKAVMLATAVTISPLGSAAMYRRKRVKCVTCGTEYLRG